MKKNLHKVKYIYAAFGLKITSDILISELLPSEGEGDIRIKLGKVPPKISDVIAETDAYQISKTEFLFYVKGIGHYYVKDGRLIVIEPEKNADSKSINVYLMGTAMGTALLQRGVVPVHGSSVVIDGRCVIFTGECGAGKSTICSAFRKKGYEFLSDDVSVITLNEEGTVMVQPAFPQQRLYSDTAGVMGYDISRLSLACKADDKYVVNDSDNFKSEPVPLAAIIEICPKADCNVGITNIRGSDKLWNFIRNIYCSAILLTLGISPIYFKKCIDTAKTIAFYHLVRPEGEYTVEQQMEIVKKTLDKL